VYHPPEFPVTCATCGGPLLRTNTARVFDRPAGPRLPVWVHARYHDWADRPHPAAAALAATRAAIDNARRSRTDHPRAEEAS
jgi:hypothetical protein